MAKLFNSIYMYQYTHTFLVYIAENFEERTFNRTSWVSRFSKSSSYTFLNIFISMLNSLMQKSNYVHNQIIKIDKFDEIVFVLL